jgi:hypothetical protein
VLCTTRQAGVGRRTEPRRLGKWCKCEETLLDAGINAGVACDGQGDQPGGRVSLPCPSVISVHRTHSSLLAGPSFRGRVS